MASTHEGSASQGNPALDRAERQLGGADSIGDSNDAAGPHTRLLGRFPFLYALFGTHWPHERGERVRGGPDGA